MEVNVNKNDWKLEMHRVLEIFEQESTSSLRKINRWFVALGRPFDEDFRQYYLKMSTLRLDSSFNTILFEQLNESRMPTSSTDGGPSKASKIGNNLDLSSAKRDSGPLNASEQGNTMKLKIENNIIAIVEISDSDDDGVEQYSGRREVNDTINDQQQSSVVVISMSESIVVQSQPNIASSAQKQTKDNAETTENADSVHAGTESNVENDGADELMDLPLEVFDPNKANDSTSERNRSATVAESMDDHSQPSTSSGAQKQIKQRNGKRFKCKQCAYTSQHKSHFQYHQLIHKGSKPFKCEHCDYAARQKHHLIGHLRTHNRQELYKCPHCDQQFTKCYGLKKHLTQTHKNNQRLFNCKRCMRRFTRKSEKDRHELQCKNRRYECHLCKTYVARDLHNMQQHIQTHSGAKPFECMVCDKRFRSKHSLKYHLNSIHSRINKFSVF